MFYERERGTNVYDGRDTSWVGKVGLMYPSDYGYATSGGSTTDRSTCLNSAIKNWGYTYLGLSDCKNNDWLLSSNEWTITSANSYSTGIFCVTVLGDMGSYDGYHYTNIVRPAVFLKSNIRIVDGDGSSSNPFELSE